MCKQPSSRSTPVSERIESFLCRARAKYGDRFTYDFTGYIDLSTSIIKITCAKHGPFETTPDCHLSKNVRFSCPGCRREGHSRTYAYADFVENAKKRHGDRYVYPDSSAAEYRNLNTRVLIECPKHGPFRQRADGHMRGQCCPTCAVREGGARFGRYSETAFARSSEARETPGHLYYLSINDGECFKVGITIARLKTRMHNIKSGGYGAIRSISLVASIDLSIGQAFDREQQILNDHASSRVYTPWSTEAFSTDIFPQIKHHFALDSS